MESPNGHATLEDHLKALKIDVFNYPQTASQVGDSGYMSFQGLPSCTGLVTPVNTLEQSSRLGDTDIGDHSVTSQTDVEHNSKIAKEEHHLADDVTYDKKVNLYNSTGIYDRSLSLNLQNTQIHSVIDDSMVSTVSSVWGDDRDVLSSPSTENWEVPSSQILEQLSNTGNKGSHRSEVQLRYLLQLFMEASCLEWSLLISVLLRDAMAVVRTVNAAKSPDQSIEAVSRLRQGLLLLNYWTNTEW